MLKRFWNWLIGADETPAATPEKPKRDDGLAKAAFKAQMANDAKPEDKYAYPVKPPTLNAGVVPDGVRPAIAMDDAAYSFAAQAFPGGGFPGYPYLAGLSTRAEYRQLASTMATELTREWIELTSSEDDDGVTGDKIKKINKELERLNIRGAMRRVAELDCLFGRGHFFIDITGIDKDKRDKPLILDPRSIKIGSLNAVTAVEPMWTTPNTYNALDPASNDFYKPHRWFMLGVDTHASRLLTVITRELPDMLKPAFNFGGISLSQLAEPYVDNWLRTRQSVADLINNFSITALKTRMEQTLNGQSDGTDLISRATLFTAMRSNKGLMLLDKDSEDLAQVNTPLSGLHELQAQAQEHMCSVSRIPAIILTGISPSGLNASSDGEIRVFYDWVAAQQEAHYRYPLEVILKVIQLSLFGEIDPDISLKFNPLYQADTKEAADVQESKQRVDVAYIEAGVIDPSEARERIARDPESGYSGLDTSVVIVPPNNPANEPDPLGDPNDTPPDTPPGSVDGGPPMATDPPVSEKQRRAMEAAAHGKSTLGIPKKVGQEFVGAKDGAKTQNRRSRRR